MRGRLTCNERRTSRRASEPSKRLKLCATSSDVDSRLVGARHERKDARNVGSRIQSACQAPEIRWAVSQLPSIRKETVGQRPFTHKCREKEWEDCWRRGAQVLE